MSSNPLPTRTDQLRIALFSGNYNMVTDGANKALNRLVGYLLAQGAAVRVYSPTVAEPAFAPTGDLVSLPSLAFPGRAESRMPLRRTGRERRAPAISAGTGSIRRWPTPTCG